MPTPTEYPFITGSHLPACAMMARGGVCTCSSVWDNGPENETARAGNPGLTHSSDLSREGLAMDATPSWSDCHIFGGGSIKLYQANARLSFENANDTSLQPHAWIVTTCGSACLNVQHMVVHSPTRIAYPAGVCIYCGFPATGKDHLVPRNRSGNARRPFVAVVPACADCNGRIGDLPDSCVDIRRERAHASLRKSKRKVLSAPDWTDDDLSEFGPNLRPYIELKRAEKAALVARLLWPDDPHYDVRAFQKSGIEDPAAIGLTVPVESGEPKGLALDPDLLNDSVWTGMEDDQ